MNELRSLSAHFGIEERFTLLRLLDTEKLTQELAERPCLMLPSYRLSAPIVVREAMAESTPVIANRVGGIPYQAEGRRTGCLFAPGGFATLRSNPDKLISSMEFRDRLGTAAISSMLAKCRAARVAAQTVGCYRQALGAVGGGKRETA
jgi:glycosyltransferase involved in cell wall biosynthesis